MKWMSREGRSYSNFSIIYEREEKKSFFLNQLEIRLECQIAFICIHMKGSHRSSVRSIFIFIYSFVHSMCENAFDWPQNTFQIISVEEKKTESNPISSETNLNTTSSYTCSHISHFHFMNIWWNLNRSSIINLFLTQNNN